MYDSILKRSDEVRSDSPTQAMLALLDMAQWRRNYIQWGEHADKEVDKLHAPPPQATNKEAAPVGPEKDRAAS